MIVNMGIINVEELYEPTPHIIIMGNAPEECCSVCGKTYISRGKNDSGICRDCEKEQIYKEAPIRYGKD